MWGKSNIWVIGDKNPNWNGGSSKTDKLRHHNEGYMNWRRRVFDRDNYTCQKCGAHGVYLEAHHIIPWRESIEARFDINNGITYCKKCHAEMDKFRKVGVL